TVVLDPDFDDAPAHLRNNRHNVVHDTNVAGGRREDVEQQQERRDGDYWKNRDGDLPWRGPRQQLQLDEDQPDEKRIDAEENDFHYRAPCPENLDSMAARSARSFASSASGMF